MRSLPIIALVLTCSTPVVAAESPLDPDEQRCARLRPTLTADSQQDQRQGETAHADRPLLYRAVEHRVAGCSVLVMHQTGQIRAVPEIDQRRALLTPAR